MGHPFSIINVSGPFREPREPAFSYDYSVQRPSWLTPQGVRVKVAIGEELDYLKQTVLGVTGGSPGQQLRLTQLLTRRIADRKLDIANDEGLFDDRYDVMIGPFSGALGHLFPKLDAWMQDSKESLQSEIRTSIGI
jgi:hypothetical protein